MQRVVFFDRDGVLNDTVDRGDNCVVLGKKVRFTAPWKYDEFKLRDGVNQLLADLKEMGFLVILATNQPDIAYKMMTPEDHEKIMADVRRLPLDDIFVCPHGRHDGCECKKPKPGMLLQAAEKHGIDLENSFMVGDTKSDTGAAKEAGCKSILLCDGRNKEVEADFRINNLSEVVDLIRKEM